MQHFEGECPLERFWYVHKTRVVYEHESFWDTEEEAKADAAKHPGCKIEPPEPKGSRFNP